MAMPKKDVLGRPDAVPVCIVAMVVMHMIMEVGVRHGATVARRRAVRKLHS